MISISIGMMAGHILLWNLLNMISRKHCEIDHDFHLLKEKQYGDN
jgi:hypothetical protein